MKGRLLALQGRLLYRSFFFSTSRRKEYSKVMIESGADNIVGNIVAIIVKSLTIIYIS